MTRRRGARAGAGWLLGLVLAAGGCAGFHGYDASYHPTPDHVVDSMLRLAKVGQDDLVYDLGSGDGRIPIAAARDYGARAVGVEIDPALIIRSVRAAERAGVAERVRFVHQDLFQTDLSPATVVTLYLSHELNARLRPKLLRELRPGTRIVSHEHPMGDWRPEQQVRIGVAGGETTLYLWTIPAP